MTNGNPNGANHLGAWANGSFTPLSGAAFGPNRNNVALTADNKVMNADPNINGAVFCPASGIRRSSGGVYYIGTEGDSWSSTAAVLDNCYNLAVSAKSIWPQQNISRPYAFPVRCIRD